MHTLSAGHELVVEEHKHSGAVYLQIEDMSLGEQFVFKAHSGRVELQKPEQIHGGIPKPIQNHVMNRFGVEEIITN